LKLDHRALTQHFSQYENAERAQKQSAYLRDQFQFFGITTPQRRSVQKAFMKKAFVDTPQKRREAVETLWKLPQREMHYFMQELFFKVARELEPDEIELIEYMITHHSWWDTVDFIAPKIASVYFQKYQQQCATVTQRWAGSGNIWLIRSAIIFQLYHKEKTDVTILAERIESQLGSKEFFINKAIGWALRQYARTNPKWVKQFVAQTHLSPLSCREATKYIYL
jgi:3-methyladenine DNA glycosylase AlkD